eukprot:5270454-Pyramimonas_sp.AAC.1
MDMFQAGQKISETGRFYRGCLGRRGLLRAFRHALRAFRHALERIHPRPSPTRGLPDGSE